MITNTSIDVRKINREWIISEYRKDKHTGKISSTIKKIPEHYVDTVRKIIQQCEAGEVYGYEWLMNKIQKEHGLNIDRDAWNGGRNRTTYYFPLHYYPLKVLEKQGVIIYNGNGSIQTTGGN